MTLEEVMTKVRTWLDAATTTYLATAVVHERDIPEGRGTDGLVHIGVIPARATSAMMWIGPSQEAEFSLLIRASYPAQWENGNKDLKVLDEITEVIRTQANLVWANADGEAARLRRYEGSVGWDSIGEQAREIVEVTVAYQGPW